MNEAQLTTIIARWREGQLTPTRLRAIYGLSSEQMYAVAEWSDLWSERVPMDALLAAWPRITTGLRGAEIRRLVCGGVR